MARIVQSDCNMMVQIRAPSGETFWMDLPTELHDNGLLYRLTHEGGMSLGVCKRTGKFGGIRGAQGEYSCKQDANRFYSSARTAAYVMWTEKRRSRAPPPTSSTQDGAPILNVSIHSTEVEREEDEECEFIRERTREERDEEGRKNAIALE